MVRRNITMMSVSQIEEALREILGPQANELAKKTGFIRRERRRSILSVSAFKIWKLPYPCQMMGNS
jgi:hypothetical protein